LKELVEAGATIQAYDPEAMEATARMLPKEWLRSKRVMMMDNQYDALKGVDALALVTEWNAFRAPDFNLMRELMRNPLIFDGRNIYDPDHVVAAGLGYDGIGKGTLSRAITHPSILSLTQQGDDTCLPLKNVS
jgi:UDPglucose 6-dehydrogenase